jgi:hypothetical protein
LGEEDDLGGHLQSSVAVIVVIVVDWPRAVLKSRLAPKYIQLNIKTLQPAWMKKRVALEGSNIKSTSNIRKQLRHTHHRFDHRNIQIHRK